MKCRYYYLLSNLFLVHSVLTQLQSGGEFEIPPGIFQTEEEQRGNIEEQTTFPPGIFTTTYEQENKPKSCMCVVFYQCENDTIIIAGEGIIGTRIRMKSMDASMLDVETCPNTNDGEPMICCKLPTVPQYTPKPCGTRGGGDEVDTSWLRISSGEETSSAEYPWMLMILEPQSNEPLNSQLNVFNCGASLIHPQVALTAAHCLKSRDPSHHKVRAGVYDTSDGGEAIVHQDRLVEQVIVPTNFHPKYIYNDVALLVLEHPFQPADNVGTICLPNLDDNFEQSSCLATGWGRSGFERSNPYQTHLKKVDLQIVPPASCQEQLRNTRLGSRFILHHSFICAIGMENQDTCQGDGGGPLVCRSVGGDHYVQAGIVSWGIGCGSKVPAVYANVARNRNWIDKQMYALGFTVNEGL